VVVGNLEGERTVIDSPEGRLLGRTHPAVNPQNMAFVDKDFKTLYMIGNALFRVWLGVAGTVQYQKEDRYVRNIQTSIRRDVGSWGGAERAESASAG
jgi:hypothetical protein